MDDFDRVTRGQDRVHPHWIDLTWTRTSRPKKIYLRSFKYLRSFTWSMTTWCYWTRRPVGRGSSQRSGLCLTSHDHQKQPRFATPVISPNSSTIGPYFLWWMRYWNVLMPEIVFRSGNDLIVIAIYLFLLVGATRFIWRASHKQQQEEQEQENNYRWETVWD